MNSLKPLRQAVIDDDIVSVMASNKDKEDFKLSEEIPYATTSSLEKVSTKSIMRIDGLANG